MIRVTFFALILLNSCAIIDPYYLNLRSVRQNEFKVQSIDPSDKSNKNPNVYSLNSSELKHLLGATSKRYKLLIFFTYWCPNSSESLPILLDDLCDTDEIEIILISPDDWVRKGSYLGYVSKYKLNVYLLDVYSYGEKRNPHYRMGKFISEFCSDCKEIKGFPSFILFDSEDSIVYKNTGKIESTVIDSLLMQYR